MAFRHSWGLAAALLAATSATSMAQTITPLKNPPWDGVIYGFLLTDGTILFQGGDVLDWWKLTPDAVGSYVNGTWQYLTSLPPDYIPYATSGGVLPDGRVLLIGGEYLEKNANLAFTLTNKMAIFDPLVNTWTEIKPPKGWGWIGDSPWTILADGRLLLGDKLTTQAAVLDAKTLTWTEVATTGKQDFNAEEGWTLLPDGSILTVDVKAHPFTERFLPNANPSLSHWIGEGKTPGDLRAADEDTGLDTTYAPGKVYHPPGEVGPAILRPDGTVFAAGADCNTPKGSSDPCTAITKVAHTAIYHPGKTLTAPGKWTAGPDFPGTVGAGDSYAVLLPNGNVLVEANPAGTERDKPAARLEKIRNGLIRPAAAASASQAPTTAIPTWQMFEFDGTKLTHEAVADFTGGQASMLLLPTGEVMLDGAYVYASTGQAAPDWAPVIKAAPKTVKGGSSYQISGTQFNGLSQANAFGDEFQVATNYPLVRITNDQSGHVFYARTHDHSSMGVATGSLIVSTTFDVPATIEHGASQLEVVANGIPSVPIAVTVE